MDQGSKRVIRVLRQYFQHIYQADTGGQRIQESEWGEPSLGRWRLKSDKIAYA